MAFLPLPAEGRTVETEAIKAREETPAAQAQDVIEPLPAPPLTEEPASTLPVYYPMKALTRPPEALTEFHPNLPESTQAYEPNAVGRVELRLWLDQSGTIAKIEMLKSDLPDELALPAIDAFRRMRFRPGEIEGIPVGSWSDIVIEFGTVQAMPNSSVKAAP